ncbi:MAG: HEAT repeat domain-containing protein [Treponema sp.]|nr:HEAT repeat domain-containing protein [Treponema sp.]
MKTKLLLILLAVLAGIFVVMVITVVCTKLIQAYMTKKRNADTRTIRPVLNRLFGAEFGDFLDSHEEIISNLADKLKGKFSRQTLEDMLLDILENGEEEIKERAHIIATFLGFPARCCSMIKSRLISNVANGCRKAGLYQCENAIPGMMKVLDILSSDTQFEVLVALARFGNTDTLVQAFDKIQRHVLINERAFNEIVNAFSGDHKDLYKRMLYHPSEYLVHLFLKAVDKETANALIDDIVAVSERGGKEMRIAGIIAIGRSGNSEKIPILIKALGDTEWEIRTMAAKTLGVLKSPEAVAPLAKAAMDREWWVRQDAIKSILTYPDSEAILVSIAQKGDAYACDSIRYILGKTKQTQLLLKVETAWQERAKNPGRDSRTSQVTSPAPQGTDPQASYANPAQPSRKPKKTLTLPFGSYFNKPKSRAAK